MTKIKLHGVLVAIACIAVVLLIAACASKISDTPQASPAPVRPEQSPVITFEKTYGFNNEKTIGLSAQQTTDDGFILFGWTESADVKNLGNMILIKTDKYGEKMWEKTFGGAKWEEGYSVQQTTDGGYICFGSTKSFGDDADMYLVKTDADGNKLWDKTYGGNKDENGRRARQTKDGGYILTGWTKSYGAGMMDMYAVRTDANGNELPGSKTYGGKGNDWARDVRETTDGGFIFVGGSKVDHTGMLNDSFFSVKTDNCGNIVWEKRYGIPGKATARAVQQTSDGEFIEVGSVDRSMYVLKIDPNGNIRWRSGRGGHGFYNVFKAGYSVQETSDGGFIIGGNTKPFGGKFSDMYMVKINSNAQTLWEKTFGGEKSDLGWAVQQTSDGGYMLFGWTSSFENERGEMYLIKTDAEGDVFKGVKIYSE